MEEIEMKGVTEYQEGYPVYLTETVGYWTPSEEEGMVEDKRLVIHASNEGGFNCTEVDVLQLIRWIRENKPELLDEAYE